MIYRMLSYQDDVIWKHKLVNNFEDGLNEFHMSDFNFLPSIGVDYLSEIGLDSLKEKQIFVPAKSGEFQLNFPELDKYIHF